MVWNIRWVFFGAMAFLLVGINLIRSVMGKRKGWEVLLFASLAFGAVTVLEEYRIAAQWMAYGEMTFVWDVVPMMSKTLTAALYIGLIMNLLVLVMNLKKN